MHITERGHKPGSLEIPGTRIDREPEWPEQAGESGASTPSRQVENEFDSCPVTDTDVQAEMAVALARLQKEVVEHRVTEEALRQANQQLQLLAANLREAVMAYDMDRRLLFANSAVEKLTGYAIEDLRRENFICWISSEHRERMLSYWDRLFRGDSYAEVEYQLVTRQGERKWVAASWGPLLDEAGRQVGVQGSERDITDRKRAEAERANLVEQLLQSQKLESIGRLAGRVAHDFNNLLTVINGYSRMLLDDLDPTDPNRPKLAQIHKSGERASELTSQLLAFSRKQVIQARSMSLNGLIEESLGMLARLAGEDVELHTELLAAPDQVMADPGQLHQVLMNLVANARDAMPSGGRLKISTSTADLDPADASYSGVSPGSYVMLDVTDTGIGMSPDVRYRVFEPYFTTKAEGKGTGLGLPTVYGIVRQSGGWIEVESSPGGGAKFRIGLPRSFAPAEDSRPVTPPGSLRGTETILVVEDQDDLRRLAVLSLENYGYRVLEACGGREALAVARSHSGKVDLLLTDVVMPGMKGTQLASRMKVICPQAGVLLMSGFVDEITALEDLPGPRAGFVPKPFDPETLARKVREVLSAT